MTLPEAHPPARDLANLFSSPNGSATVSSIGDIDAMGASVLRDASAEEEIVLRTLISLDIAGRMWRLPTQSGRCTIESSLSR
jgi:hypothetical protein